MTETNAILPPPVRREVIVFAQQMEIILRQHEDKGGWDGCSEGWLIDRIGQELREVRRAYRAWVGFRDFKNKEEHNQLAKAFQHELIDVANFCMMAFDVLESTKDITSGGK